MTKTDLIAQVAANTEMSKKSAEMAVNAAFEALGKAMAEGEKISISGFGTFEVRERAAGESKWSTWLLIKYALSNITAFTSLPLHLITGCGAASFLAALIVGIVSIVRLAMGRVVTGLTGAVILLLFLSGLIMVGLGIIGYYLGNIYMEIQDRPRFIVSETCGVRKKT